MTQTSRDGAYWLRRRVRVWSGNVGPKVVLAEGVVLSYSPAPTIMVRDAQGRDSHWQVTLPIDTLEEKVSAAELTELSAAGDRRRAATTGRSRELRSQLYRWLGMFTAQFTGTEHDHGTLRHLSDKLAEMIEQLPMPIEGKLNEILRAAGIEYPLGLRGVRDLVAQRDGHLERAREAEELASRTHEAMMAKYAEAGELRDELAKRTASLEMSVETSRLRGQERDELLAEVTELRALKARLEEKRTALGMSPNLFGRELRMLDEITGDLT